MVTITLINKHNTFISHKKSMHKIIKHVKTGRKQQIKLQGDLSSWADIQKGVPQGSILGALLFKIFINDIFYFIEYGTLYNYADDNTLSYVKKKRKLSIDRLVQIQLYAG
jgi:hypothetical protein